MFVGAALRRVHTPRDSGAPPVAEPTPSGPKEGGPGPPWWVLAAPRQTHKDPTRCSWKPGLSRGRTLGLSSAYRGYVTDTPNKMRGQVWVPPGMPARWDGSRREALDAAALPTPPAPVGWGASACWAERTGPSRDT